MGQWHVHIKIIDREKTIETKKKFRKTELEEFSINHEKQLFESKNPASSIAAIELDKIRDKHLFKVTKKPILGLFKPKFHYPSLKRQYSATLKLRLLNDQAVDKLNSILVDPRLKYYVANQKKEQLERFFSGGVENAMIVLSILNKEFQDSQFSPKMRQALLELFYKDPNSKEALAFKKSLENFSLFIPENNTIPHWESMKPN